MLPLSAYADRSPRDAIAAIPGFEVKEIAWTSFAGEALYLATNGRGETRLVPMRGEPQTTLDPEAVLRVVRDALGASATVRMLHQYDAYYLDRHRERPAPGPPREDVADHEDQRAHYRDSHGEVVARIPGFAFSRGDRDRKAHEKARQRRGRVGEVVALRNAQGAVSGRGRRIVLRV